MGISRNLNARLFRPFNSKNVDNAQHILNKKANAKLTYVAGVFGSALKGYWEVIEDGFLYKRIALLNLGELKELKISYYLQNRFFARIYDLQFDFEIPAKREEEAKFQIAYTGVTQVTGAKFNLSSGDSEDLAILKRLNSALIVERLVKLDFLDFSISFNTREQKWIVSADSIIGSATWNLLPPMFQVIKPTDKECIMMMELFQLVIDALIRQE